jgi:hypothetical protein
MNRIALAAIDLLFAVVGAAAQQNFPTPNGAVASITAVATGTTAAVTATLAGAPSKTTFICGFAVSAAGGTATVSPIVIGGLLGGSFTYQGISAGQTPFQHLFDPCVPASNSNVPISLTTTADSTATSVDVQLWGFQQ